MTRTLIQTNNALHFGKAHMAASGKLILLKCLFILSFFTVSAQEFLRVEGKQIVNENGNIILRGIGLGGWMVQEGYMLKVNGEGQQHKIREKI